MSDYQKRTPERLVEILRAQDQNPRSWQQDAICGQDRTIDSVPSCGQENDWRKGRDDYAYRFQYADGSACHIYADGRHVLVFRDGRREEKRGIIDNRIPALIGQAAKPRQDEIERLRAQLASARKALEFIRDGYGNQDLNHVDFRVGAYQAALDALTDEEGTSK